MCKECGGRGICEHGRQREKCRECGGSSICEHGRQRSQCKECGGASICEHSRQRSKCKECGGGGICEHGRQRSQCKECGGRGICEHGRQRTGCPLCRPEGAYGAYLRSERRKIDNFSDQNFMSFETYQALIKLPCVWCGRTPEQANGMGVDRRDNKLGHTEGNLD